MIPYSTIVDKFETSLGKNNRTDIRAGQSLNQTSLSFRVSYFIQTQHCIFPGEEHLSIFGRMNIIDMERNYFTFVFGYKSLL